MGAVLKKVVSGYQTQFLFGEEPSPRIELRNGYDLDLVPLDATFRDGGRAPLHSWFPYLEGYSPRFVQRVRHEFLPDAKRIIEPFAGSGTTPIVLGQAGIECAYSEANPAMAFVVQTKLSVLEFSVVQRKLLAGKIVTLAHQLRERVASVVPDNGLYQAYTATFDGSVFFSSVSLDTILRLRTVNDEVSIDDKALGDCLSLAILASLIPSSYLKRAGDLRYKTEKELLPGLPHPIDAVSERLLAQSADLPFSSGTTAQAHFASDVAVSLKDVLEGDWDGVITSPPYLNGTNYIRNARLELWYLRHLYSKADLRRLRDRVITSGINDVDAQTDWRPITEGVSRVVSELEAKSYDQRIAKMVGGYFRDMGSALSSLNECLRPGARLCIDIGDSIYAGVHVATDDLLVEVAERIGLRSVERVHLRDRISKGGQSVRQQLLVFEKPFANLATLHSVSEAKESDSVGWQVKWETFKQEMPHQAFPYSKREWGGPAHSMCSYQGKMKPALAHHLIECFSNVGDVVVDPFSGSGTIPFEACRMGRYGYGVDISRLGHVLTLAKVAQTSEQKVERLLQELEAYIKDYQVSQDDQERAAAVRFNSAIPEYFHPDTFREVIAARHFFLSQWNSGPEWALLFASTLHLLHGNRPYALSRRSHPVTPFKPTGEFEYRALMPRLREKLARLKNELESSTRTFGASAQADCTRAWPELIPQADMIITSPPFFDSTRFYMTNWMRFWFVGWEREDFDVYPVDFMENRQKQSLDIYCHFFEASRERLKSSGMLVLHLGQSAKCDMGAELAKRVEPWFSVMDCFTEGVEHCESHGVRDKGTVHGHTYLVLAAK